MLTLRRDLLRRRLEQTGPVKIQLAWPPESRRPSHTTLWRWANGAEHPRTPAALLSLAVALDVDPLSLCSVDPSGMRETLSAVHGALRDRSRWKKDFFSALSLIEHFAGPREDWPPSAVASCFRRPWETREFAYLGEPKTSPHYAVVRLEAGFTGLFHDPQVFHFAYRDRHVVDGGWRPYAHAEVAGSELEFRLTHYNGYIESEPCRPRECRLEVETFFGPRPADFRVASIHPFSLCVTSDARSSIPRLRCN